MLQEEGDPKKSERFLRFTCIPIPVRFLKVSECPMGRFWEVYLEKASQLDNDWRVVGAVAGYTGCSKIKLTILNGYNFFIFLVGK